MFGPLSVAGKQNIKCRDTCQGERIGVLADEYRGKNRPTGASYKVASFQAGGHIAEFFWIGRIINLSAVADLGRIEFFVARADDVRAFCSVVAG